MATLQRLEQALQNAHSAGDEAAARQIASDIRRMQAQPAAEPERYNALQDDTSVLDRVLIGMGRGFTDVGQGISQLARHGAELIPGVDAGADEYDKRIAREAAMFNRDAEGSIAAQGGRIGGNIAATAVPAGAAGRVAAVGGKALGLGRTGQAIAAGSGAGATEAGLLADTDGESGIGDRLTQAGVGAVLGGAGGAAVEGVRRGVQGVVNAPRRTVGALSGGQSSGRGATGRMRSVVSGNARQRARAEAAARELGVDPEDLMTPAAISGSRVGNTLENTARQSVFTADEVLTSDMRRSRGFLNQVRQMAGRLGGEGDNVTVAKQIQGATRNMTRKLADERSQFGRKAYGEVDRAAQGQPVVQMSNTREALESIVDEYRGVQSGDAAKVARQASAVLQSIGDEPMTAQQALRNMQAWSQAARGTGKLFDDVDRGVDTVLARRLSEAVMGDLDNVASSGGSVGDAVRRANQGWRQYSQRIDSVKNSVLGEVLGEDFADDVAGMAYNKIAPEKVFDKLKRATPSQLEVAVGYLDESAPEVAGNFRRSLIQNALEAAQEAAPSAGGNTLPIHPGVFIKTLQGGASGERAVTGLKRLRTVFGETPEWPKIEALFEIGERMSDATGRNFSNTAVMQEARGALGIISALAGNVTGAIQKGAGALGPALGLRQVARSMDPRRASLPYFQVPQQAVTNAAVTSGVGAGLVAPQLTEKQRQDNR